LYIARKSEKILGREKLYGIVQKFKFKIKIQKVCLANATEPIVVAVEVIVADIVGARPRARPASNNSIAGRARIGIGNPFPTTG
jgi:hypothetical protein